MRRSPILATPVPLLLPLLLVAFAACNGDDSAARSSPTQQAQRGGEIVIPAGSPIAIGVSSALTGEQSAIGVDIADAAEMAAADYGGSLRGHVIELRRRNDGCNDAERAAAIARELAEMENIAGVIGPMCTTGAVAAGAVYEQVSTVHITPSVTRPEISEQGARFFFRTAWREDLQARTQAAYARDTLGAETAVVVDDGEPYGKALADAFTQAFEQRGGRVLSRERIERGEVDFSSLAARVKSAEPSLLVFQGLNPEGALIVRKLRESDYGGTFLAPDGVLNFRDFIVAAGPAAEGAVLTAGPLPDTGFIDRFRLRAGHEPATPFALQAHDAMTLLLRAIEATAVERDDGALVIDRQKLADAVRATDFEGLTGAFSFDERGDRTGDTARDVGLVVYRVSNGRFEPQP